MTDKQYPQPFVSAMTELLGEEEAALFFDAMRSEPSVAVRINPRKLRALPEWLADADNVGWCPDGFYLRGRPIFTLMPELHAGAFYVQDPSSMIHQQIMASIADGPVRVLDLCAAPGGKTTAALNALPDGSLMVANECMPPRAAVLRENLLKYGYPATIVTRANAASFGKMRSMFDIIIADVPCSGEGMMRKEPEAVRQWSPELVDSCAALQREIVADAIDALRPGGHLIYSTCTFNRTENERNVEMICRRHGLSIVDSPRRFMPHITRGEGLFVATLRKDGDGARINPRTPSKKERMPKEAAPAASWIIEPDKYCLSLRGNTVNALPKEHIGLLAEVERNAAVIAAGVDLATLKGRDVIPAHTLALSGCLRRGAFPEAVLDKQQALAYLRKDPLSLPGSEPRGFILVTYNNLPLGFVKNLGNRCNNLYPSEWRIRMR